jgi:hypothetical protein
MTSIIAWSLKNAIEKTKLAENFYIFSDRRLAQQLQNVWDEWQQENEQDLRSAHH